MQPRKPPGGTAGNSAAPRTEHERQLEALVENSPDVIFRLDPGLRHLFITRNVRKMSGHPAESFIGRTGREVGLPADACDAFEAAAREAIASGATVHVDFSIGESTFRSRLIPEIAPDGSVMSLMGITEDVTERRRADRHTSFINRLGQRLSTITDPQEIVRMVARAVGEHLRCARCYFAEIDEAGGIVVVHPDWTRDASPSVAGTHRMADFAPPEMWRAVQAGRFAIDDVASHPFTRDLARSYAAMGVRALANAAFVSKGNWVVHLSVNDSRPRRWHEDEISLLERVVARVWPLVLRARTEQALRESEARARLALAAGRMVAWDVDPATGRTTLSDSAADVLGLPAERVLEGVAESRAHIHPEDRERHWQRVRDALRSGDAYTAQFRVIRPDDGRIVWIEDRGRVVRDAQGRLVRVSGLLMDVTERVTAEQQARRLASMLEATPDFVAMMRSDGKLEYVNRSGRRMIGLDRRPDAELPHGSEVLPAWAAERTLSEWLPAALREGAVSAEGALLDADGREIPVSFVLLVHRSESGEVEYVSTLARDIGERKRAEETLREADRRKDEFLAMLAHELRNPLAPIRNAIEILKLRAGDDPQVAWPRDLIDRQVDHLTRLVDDLLDVSRITRGRIELKKEVLDLVAVVGRAVEACRPLVDARKQHLEVALPSETLRLEGDLTRLSQVVSNLLHNAAKYTEEGGHISLRAERAGDQVVVRVRDDGIGIASDVLPHVFELFAQSERTLDRAQGGLGIGLTVVKRLVEMHGGSVEARSEGTGRGSEFVVRLPLVATPERERRGAGAVPMDTTIDGRRVLVVDDNVDAAESIALLLTLEGHDVRTAHDAASGIATAHEFDPEVVLLDIGLPGMNGYEVARELRRDPQLRDSMLVAVTGYGTAEDRERAMQAGFDHHMTKPVDHDSLGALIKSLVPPS